MRLLGWDIGSSRLPAIWLELRAIRLYPNVRISTTHLSSFAFPQADEIQRRLDRWYAGVSYKLPPRTPIRQSCPSTRRKGSARGSIVLRGLRRSGFPFGDVCICVDGSTVDPMACTGCRPDRRELGHLLHVLWRLVSILVTRYGPDHELWA